MTTAPINVSEELRVSLNELNENAPTEAERPWRGRYRSDRREPSASHSERIREKGQ